MTDTHYHFYLGGNDLEMETIRALLAEHTQSPVYDKNLSWGASSADYHQELQQTLAQNAVPVLIELEWNTPDLPSENLLHLDHHNQRAGNTKPTALEQLFKLLKIPKTYWTRHLDLVVANDKGHIRGLQKIGATINEIAAIRAADRAAQGVTIQDEQQAEQAVAQVELACGNQLMIVKSDTDKTSAIADRLAPELTEHHIPNLLIVGPKEINVYANGAIIHALAQSCQPAWYGGSLPERGFWGCQHPEKLKTVLQVIDKAIG